jgi:hypothetical protein
MVTSGLQVSQESIASMQRPIFPFSDVYDGAQIACPICLLTPVAPFAPFHHSVVATCAMDQYIFA